MTGIMCAMAGAPTWASNTVAITVGTFSTGTDAYYGFDKVVGYGSAAPSNVTIFGGAALTRCDYDYATLLPNDVVDLTVSGNQTGVSWTSMTINGTVYTKASANVPSGTYDSGSNTTSWAWFVSIGSNPFGTTVGAVKTVVFA